jgi:RNA polymerase sigma-70 factor (ECF subfamily)
VSALRAVEVGLPPSSSPGVGELTAELVERAKAGDLGAFEQLVHLTSPGCFGLAFRLVGNEHDARDVVQDAYLRAFKGLRRFRGEASFQTWLYRITVNCAASHLERRARSAHDLLDDIGDAGSIVDEARDRDPEAVASNSDDRDRLVEALAELPHPLRMVVVLRDVYDLPHKEIAKQLGISQAAAKVRLHRARRKLQERLFAERAPVRS